VVTSVFNATDPVVRRRIFGIARLDLATRNLDFTAIGPAVSGMSGLHVAPDRKIGYSVAYTTSGAGGVSRRTEFWVFDISARKLLRKHEFEARTRFSFALSGDGKKLYIYGAGPTLDIYDAQTFKLERAIAFDGDSTTGLLVVRPRNSSGQ
jgi:hypothetical protein